MTILTSKELFQALVWYDFSH